MRWWCSLGVVHVISFRELTTYYLSKYLGSVSASGLRLTATAIIDNVRVRLAGFRPLVLNKPIHPSPAPAGRFETSWRKARPV